MNPTVKRITIEVIDGKRLNVAADQLTMDELRLLAKEFQTVIIDISAELALQALAEVINEERESEPTRNAPDDK